MCGQGFSGIAQETRLVYAMLACMPGLELGGLLNPLHDLVVRSKVQGPPRVSADLAYQSQLVAALGREIDGERRSTLWRKLERRLFGKSSGRRLLPSAPFRPTHRLQPIDGRRFGDFLWMTYFEKTLPASRRSAVLDTDYAVLDRGWLEAANALGCSGAAQGVDTREWDFLLCQQGWPFRLPHRTRLLVRYHDAIPVFLPHTLSAKSAAQDAKRHVQLLRHDAGRGGFFVCTSEPVRDDLLALEPKLETRSLVIPDVVAPDFWLERASWRVMHQILERRSERSTNDERPSLREGEPRPFLLAVSTLEPRKNFLRLLQAWRHIVRDHPARPLLVVVANIGWRCEDELADIASMVRCGELLHLSKVPLDEMRLLYSNAQAVICPSRAEGFDLSGIEAMLCGTLVLASDIAVHRAVYADAALYFDPYDVQDLGRRLTDALNPVFEAEHMAELRARGLHLGRRYTEEAIAPQWQMLLERLACDSLMKSTSNVGSPMERLPRSVRY